MKNSFRAVSFIIPFLTIIFSITYIIPKIPGIENGTLFFSVLMFLVIGVFPLFQGAIRYIYFRKFLYQSNFFFSIKLGESKLYQRVYYYLLIFLVLVFPLIGRNFELKNLKPINFLIIGFFIIISEVLLYLSYEHTKIKFMSNGILIFGSDFRVDFPIGGPMRSHSGFYYYSEIHWYKVKKDHIKFELDNNDVIEGRLPDGIKKQVIHFLAGKDIRTKK
ncbi:MAG TPA: hypothetical protein VJ962_02540 [Clostridia bacterium]|nr:hypothetical protein [Clostridia bacterium]